jgi:hypothetical protein
MISFFLENRFTNYALETRFSFRACLGLSLRNRAFKSKRAFGQKLHFKAFAKNAFGLFLGSFFFFYP